MSADAVPEQTIDAAGGSSLKRRGFLLLSIGFVLLHIFFVLFRYGQLPAAPVVSDEVVINDPSVSLAHGHGYVAESFGDSGYGLDRVYAHFPPLYPYTEAVAFRLFGVSVYTLRLTTTVMSVSSTVVLLVLLYRLCAFGMLSWDVALLVQALYCTNASYVALERTARMESMISLLVLLSLLAIVWALTLPAQRRLPWLLMAGLAGALTVAVHPEAVTAVLLLAALILFVVPTTMAVRLTSMALFALTPLAVGLGIYRANFLMAVRLFLAIAHDANAGSRSSYEWLTDALHSRDVSTMSRNVLLLQILLLLAVPALSYVWLRRPPSRGGVQYRMAASLGAVGVAEMLLMVFPLHMDTRRCQFLLGPGLVCAAVCLWGSRSLRRWERSAGWLFVVLQCLIAGYYLYPRPDRLAGINPDRFAGLIRGLPREGAVAATPGLWLDLKEVDRPFTLILDGLDGERTWSETRKNPLSGFDVVILEGLSTGSRPWLRDEAAEGRTDTVYHVGGETVEVYVRDHRGQP